MPLWEAHLAEEFVEVDLRAAAEETGSCVARFKAERREDFDMEVRNAETIGDGRVLAELDHLMGMVEVCFSFRNEGWQVVKMKINNNVIAGDAMDGMMKCNEKGYYHVDVVCYMVKRQVTLDGEYGSG